MITALCRTVILYLILMIGLRLMGKRQIGELEPSELVLTLILSDLAAVPMQDYGIPLVNGLLPIVTLLCLSMLTSYFTLKSLRFRSLVCGEPTVMIRDGVIQQAGMARNRFTVDELLEQLRTQGCSDPRTVKYAVLETSGQLSVLPYPQQSSAAPQNTGSDGADAVTLPILLVSDGRLLFRNLRSSGYDRTWLETRLREYGAAGPEEVFLMTVDEREQIIFIRKEPTP